MIKVPARRKFSRKTSGPLSRSSFNLQRSNQKNRSSIMLNADFNLNYLEFQQASETYQTQTNSKKTIFNQSLGQFNSNQPQQKPKHGLMTSMKLTQKFITPQTKTQIQNTKFSKIDNLNSSLIKIEENEYSKNSSKNLRMSESTKRDNVRTSAMKKISKYETPFSRSRNMRKASIFHHTHNMTVTHESEQYEQFLRQSNLDQLTKKVVCQKVIENDSDKQNEEISERKSNFYTQDKKSPRPSKSKMNTEMEPDRNSDRTSRNLLRRLSSNTKKSSQKQIKVPKQNRKSYKEIFHSMTQTAIKQHYDTMSDTQRQESKMSRTYNDQETTLRKQEQLKSAQQKRIETQRIYKEQTQELFRRLEREIASKQEMDRFERKSNNYYQDLRRKLVEKYERIWKDYRMDESQRDNIGLLIDGCNLQRHRRVNNFYFEKKQSAGGGRIDAAAIGQATKDINRLNFINKDRNKTIMRPQTSRPKSSYKTKVVHSHEKSSNMLSDYIINTASMKTQSNIFSKQNNTYNKLSETDTDCIFNMTNPDIKSRCNLKSPSMERPKTAVSRSKNVRDTGATDYSVREKQILKEKVVLTGKFDALLDICDEESNEREDTKKKMKAFEYYCTKIDNGFEKLSQRITDYVANM